MNAALAVAAGGAAGSLARYWVVVALRAGGPAFPWGTLAVNVAGSAIIGALWAWFLARPDSPEWVRVGLMTGVMGGFTTLSSVSLETVLLLQSGAVAAALANAGANLLISLAACAATLAACRPLFN